MVRQKRYVAIIVLRCAIFGCCASAQQAAFGTGMAAPPQSAAGDYVLVAQAYKPTGPQAIVQETKSADTPAEPQAVMRENKSATRLSSGKQRRRKPKMAGVPAEAQVAAKGAVEPSQAAVKDAKGPESPAVAKESEPQAAVRETEETGTLDKPLAVAQKTNNADMPAKPQTEAKGLKAEKGGKKYRMAPIKWVVGISETAGSESHSRTNHPVNGPASTTQSSGAVNTQIVEARAKTYIMQPYIAQLGGSIGVVSSKNISEIGNGSRSNRLFGDGSLALFSQSRFPFNMSFAVSNDRNNSESQTQNTVNRRLNLDQSYRPLSSNSMYTGGYMRDTQTSNFSNWNALSDISPNDTVTRSSWNGGYTTSTPEHRIRAATRFNDRVTHSATNVFTRVNDFTLSDTYMPASSLLSLDSNANLNTSSSTDFLTRLLQVYTNATWQPEDEDIPLFVDGNVRLFRMATIMQDGSTTSSQSLGGKVGARYLFSKNLTGRADGSVTSTSLNGTRSLITTQRGDVSYSSDAVRLWKNSSYSWNASGGASNQTGGNSDSNVFGSVGHGLSIPYTFNMLGKKLLMNSRINQSLGTNISRVNGRSFTLSNGGSISVGGIVASARPDKELLGGYGMTEGTVNTTATLSVSDTRTMGGKNPSHQRTSSLLVHLQESSKSIYSRYGLEVEATLEAVQGTGGGKMALLGSSTARYRKSRVFGVRGLDYVASLKISAQSSNAGISDANAQNPKYPWEFDHRLRYRIGQNEVLFRGNITDQYGVKNASLWLLFRAWRSIGN